MPYSEDHIALAAEYALGTLDADERAQVETMMTVDKDFAAVVDAWQLRLAVLNQMVGSVEPRPIVWENIRAAISPGKAQAPLALPEAPSPPQDLSEAGLPEAAVPEVAVPEVASPQEVAVPEVASPQEVAAPGAVAAPPVEAIDHGKLASLENRVRRWRLIAGIAAIVALVLLSLVALQVLLPDALPDGLRAKPRIKTVEIKVPQPPPAPSAQYVALLQGEGSGPAFILAVDGVTRGFSVRRLGANTEAGKSFELWLISDKLPSPRSLGVIGNGDFTARSVLAAYDRDVITGASYVITLEQAGGSPDGTQHSAPLFTGKLVETVHPAAAAQPLAAQK